MRILPSLILGLVITTQAIAATKLSEEGANQGYINAIDCVGTGISCARSGITGTLTVNSSATAAGGSNANVQYASGTSFAGDTSFNWNSSANLLGISRDSGQVGIALVISSDTSVTLASISHDGGSTFNSMTLKNSLSADSGGSGAATHTDGGVLIGKGTAAFQNTGVLAKGTLIVGDAVTNPTTLTVGTNGFVLSADSSTASGLVWSALPSGGAGDITAVGDVASGAAFSGTQGSTLTFLKEVSAAINIGASTTADTAGADFEVNGATGNGAASGGGMYFYTGGSGSGATGNGGDIEYGGGSSAATNGSGGNIYTQGGTGAGTGGGGFLSYNAGSGGSSGSGGLIEFYAGNSGATAGNGGNLRFEGGDAVSAAGNGGDALITAGNAVDGIAGDITLTLGVESGTGTDGVLKVAGPESAGLVIQTGANTACTTTCTGTCLIGFDVGTLGVSLAHIVACSSATADECLCSA